VTFERLFITGHVMPGETDQPVEAVVRQIDITLLRLHNLESCVRSVEAHQDSVLQRTFQDVAAALVELNNLAESLSVECPEAVVQWVDEGRDSDSCYQAIFADTIWLAQACGHSLQYMHADQMFLLRFLSSQKPDQHRDGGVQVMQGRLSALQATRQMLEAGLAERQLPRANAPPVARTESLSLRDA
jgi:hypothetical protein